jgi:hypothetical protein
MLYHIWSHVIMFTDDHGHRVPSSFRTNGMLTLLSMTQLLEPRVILKKPLSPQPGPQLFFTSQ